MTTRLEIREQILSCTRCSLHTSCRNPVPMSGPAPATVAVVGEAPGAQEDMYGKPFIGASGRLLRRQLRLVGIVPDDLAWINTVSCFPHRTPNREEIDSCRDNLVAQLQFVSPGYIVLAGSVALSAWYPGLTVTEMRGKWVQVPVPELDTMPWGLVTYHPAAALYDSDKTRLIKQDLEQLQFYRHGVFEPTEPDYCVKCGSGHMIRTWNNITLCPKHRKAIPEVEKMVEEEGKLF